MRHRLHIALGKKKSCSWALQQNLQQGVQLFHMQPINVSALLFTGIVKQQQQPFKLAAINSQVPHGPGNWLAECLANCGIVSGSTHTAVHMQRQFQVFLCITPIIVLAM